MEIQSTLAYYTGKVVQPSLSLFGILKEAYKTSFRNGRLLLFITFIMFSCYSILDLGSWFIILPIVEDLEAHVKLLPKNGSFGDADSVAYNKLILNDVRHFLTYSLVALFFWVLITVLAVTSTVYSTFEAYTAKGLSLKDMLLGSVSGKYKRAFKTSVWIVLISLASAALLYLVFGVILIMAQGPVLSGLNLNWVFFILGGCYAVYLCSLSMFSLVVSVLEEEKSGLKAIIEGNELMKGTKLQEFVLMVVVILAAIANSKGFGYLETVTGTENATLAMVIGVAISFPGTLVFCLLKVFVFVVFTLFYHECKMNKIAEENRALYAPIAAVAEF
ncbi:OLC1v1035358C1 [Oldenlandia corymbosa var. corymbosa]|uniref:OLC1v1035358C1 n=1 Tax=Oldenlandia corymbosa var. corymbosa TaxID=529605 RepID=A0AAV1CU47_OLDCO|nr:OLC1v1035358C1 [Oldenlandia corymbosa var. corymbosa]